MANPNKPRGFQRHQELDIGKHLPFFDDVPDDGSLGRLQSALETLLSERSHPMVVALQKQLERLKTAESVIEHEMSTRKARNSQTDSSGSALDPSPKKRRLSEVEDEAGESETEIKEDKQLENIESHEIEPESPPHTELEVNSDTHEDESAEESGEESAEEVDEEPSEDSGEEEAGEEIVEESVKPEEEVEEANEESNEEEDEIMDSEEHNISKPTPEESIPDTGALEEQEPEVSVEHDEIDHEENDHEENEESESLEDHGKPEEKEEPEEQEEHEEHEEHEQHEEQKKQEDQDNTEKHEENTELTDSTQALPQNDKFILNPKSEFVETQKLPPHALGLLNENQTDENDEEYKRRLGVVSYPKEDLSTLTAGSVPMDDFTRSKPSNQIQFQTYATFLEPYFRPFTEEDIQFLQQPMVGVGLEATNLRTGKKLSPYDFPPLGPHFHQQWAQQDAELTGVELSESAKKANGLEVENLKKLYQVSGSMSDVTDQILETPITAHASALTSNTSSTLLGNGNSNNGRAISLGPLTERLIAAIMPEVYDSNFQEEQDEISSLAIDKSVSLIPPSPTPINPIDDFAHLEERVKGEFRYVGVFDMSLLRKFDQTKSQYKLAVSQSGEDYSSTGPQLDWINGSEDDEVSRELRVLQRKLKEVSSRNIAYKQRLLPVLHQQMAWQEYESILQDLDKQVDQAFMKRSKAPKSQQPKFKKKKSSDSPSGDSPEPVFEEKAIDQKPAIKALMEKRERWITKIGPLFKPAYMMMREYEHPKFENIDVEFEDEDEDE